MATELTNQIGIQNNEDLEKIKEDSAESFIEVHNQDGLVLVVAATQESKPAQSMLTKNPQANVT